MKIRNMTKRTITFRGITLEPGQSHPHPLDHDGDGRKGGSLPKEKSEDKPKKRGRPKKEA